MKPLQLTKYITAQLPAEPSIELSKNNYLAYTQVQPLTDLMFDIIIFQLRERALFVDIEIPDYSLNWFIKLFLSKDIISLIHFTHELISYL